MSSITDSSKPSGHNMESSSIHLNTKSETEMVLTFDLGTCTFSASTQQSNTPQHLCLLYSKSSSKHLWEYKSISEEAVSTYSNLSDVNSLNDITADYALLSAKDIYSALLLQKKEITPIYHHLTDPKAKLYNISMVHVIRDLLSHSFSATNLSSYRLCLSIPPEFDETYFRSICSGLPFSSVQILSQFDIVLNSIFHSPNTDTVFYPLTDRIYLICDCGGFSSSLSLIQILSGNRYSHLIDPVIIPFGSEVIDQKFIRNIWGNLNLDSKCPEKFKMDLKFYLKTEISKFKRDSNLSKIKLNFPQRCFSLPVPADDDAELQLNLGTSGLGAQLTLPPTDISLVIQRKNFDLFTSQLIETEFFPFIKSFCQNIRRERAVVGIYCSIFTGGLSKLSHLFSPKLEEIMQYFLPASVGYFRTFTSSNPPASVLFSPKISHVPSFSIGYRVLSAFPGPSDPVTNDGSHQTITPRYIWFFGPETFSDGSLTSKTVIHQALISSNTRFHIKHLSLVRFNGSNPPDFYNTDHSDAPGVFEIGQLELPETLEESLKKSQYLTRKTSLKVTYQQLSNSLAIKAISGNSYKGSSHQIFEYSCVLSQQE